MKILLTAPPKTGKSTCLSNDYLTWVDSLFESCDFILATIVYDDEPFSRKYKSDPNRIHIELTKENRDWIPSFITNLYGVRNLYNQLSETQKIYLNKTLSQYCIDNNHIMAEKITKKLLPYYFNNKIEEKDKFNLVFGKHDIHTTTPTTCDCDLFKGKGVYTRQPNEHMVTY